MEASVLGTGLLGRSEAWLRGRHQQPAVRGLPDGLRGGVRESGELCAVEAGVGVGIGRRSERQRRDSAHRFRCDGSLRVGSARRGGEGRGSGEGGRGRCSLLAERIARKAQRGQCRVAFPDPHKGAKGTKGSNEFDGTKGTSETFEFDGSKGTSEFDGTLPSFVELPKTKRFIAGVSPQTHSPFLPPPRFPGFPGFPGFPEALSPGGVLRAQRNPFHPRGERPGRRAERRRFAAAAGNRRAKGGGGEGGAEQRGGSDLCLHGERGERGKRGRRGGGRRESGGKQSARRAVPTVAGGVGALERAQSAQ